MKINHKFLVFGLLLLVSIAGRFLPHMWNMTPIGALAIVASLKLGLAWGLALPLVTLLVSDLFLGFYSWPIMLSVYLLTVIYSLSGFLVSGSRPSNIASASGDKIMFPSSVIPTCCSMLAGALLSIAGALFAVSIKLTPFG